MQLLQLFVHVPIHVIELRRVRPLETFYVACESQQRALDMMQITHQYGRFAAPETGDQPGGADVRHLVVGTFKHNQMRHITLCAVRVMRHHTELLLPSRMLEHAAGCRRHRHFHATVLAILHATAFGDPIAQQVVAPITPAKPPTAFVSHLHQRLG